MTLIIGIKSLANVALPVCLLRKFNMTCFYYEAYT